MARTLGDSYGGDELLRTITVPQGVALYLGAVLGAGVLLDSRRVPALTYRRLLAHQRAPAKRTPDAIQAPSPGGSSAAE